MWLFLYFLLNLCLTLYNKSVLIHFPFPYTLTALHALCGAIGTLLLVKWEQGRLARWSSGRGMMHHRKSDEMEGTMRQEPFPSLNRREMAVLVLFSVLYTLNIVVSNASLRLVTVPFHQVVRASTPFFTLVVSAIILRKGCSTRKALSLIPVVAGVGFATYGDYYFTLAGFLLTLLGTILAAFKTVITNLILVKQPSSQQDAASSLPTIRPSSSYPTLLLLQSRSKSRSPSPPPISPSEKSDPPNYHSNPSIFRVSMYKPSFDSTHSTSLPSSISLPSFRDYHPNPNPSPNHPFFPKLHLSPLHLLTLLSPLAFIQSTLLAQFTGELDQVRGFFFKNDKMMMMSAVGSLERHQRIWLVLNGVLAFGLNVVSFNANRKIGPLGMCVAANVKQVLTVLLAVFLFDLTITPANGLGIGLTILGGAIYAMVEIGEKERAKMRMLSVSTSSGSSKVLG